MICSFFIDIGIEILVSVLCASNTFFKTVQFPLKMMVGIFILESLPTLTKYLYTLENDEISILLPFHLSLKSKKWKVDIIMIFLMKLHVHLLHGLQRNTCK